MKIMDLLPIGSVVMLKNGQKRLMVAGIMQSDASKEGKEYHYMGVLYPEGHIGEDLQFLFNHEDIEDIVFRGYEDEERAAFLAKLSGFYEKQ